jgi:hypothetical protein
MVTHVMISRSLAGTREKRQSITIPESSILAEALQAENEKRYAELASAA